MIVKVNRINSLKQIEFLSEVDIFNIHLEKNVSGIDSNAISFEQALSIREKFPNISLSVFFNNYSAYTNDEKSQILKTLRANYYECSAPDYAKVEDYKLFLTHLQEIDFPKIVSGFFISKDDNYLLDERQKVIDIIKYGVQFLEVDVDSTIKKSFKLGTSVLREFEMLCSQVPILYSDSFTEKEKIFLKNSKGIYLNLESLKNDIYNFTGYDPKVYNNVTSIITFKMIEIKKIVRQIRILN